MRIVSLLIALFALCSTPVDVGAQTGGVGACGFDARTLSFAGDARQQARCLLRPVEPYAHLGVERALPSNLGGLVGTTPAITREALRERLAGSSVVGERALAASLDRPVSRAHDDRVGAPSARYFVIHDTSTPNYGTAPFPSDLDTNDRVNSFRYYARGEASKAHVFVNRRGELEIFRDFAVPWRATKLELRRVGTPAKGLFLHVELIQPRRNDARGIDAFSPDPGFSQAQYERLAVLYTVASVRAGSWLIPAFHGVVDAQIEGGHDDPQNFDLDAFDSAIGTVLSSLSDTPTASTPVSTSATSPVTPLRTSLYYTALQSDYPAGASASFRDRNGTVLARGSQEFLDKARIEGSAKLDDGRMLNVDRIVAGEMRWMLITQPFGLDAGGCGLVPFRSAAVDRDVIPLRTRLHLPETVGMRLPDGSVHDGTWYAVDTGAAIRADRIDLFVGAGRAAMEVPRRHGIGHLQALQATVGERYTGCIPAA